MKSYVVQVSNGTMSIVSEWSNLDQAKRAFHTQCAKLWNAQDVVKATVKLMNESLDVIQGYVEVISHEQPTPEPVEE